MADCEYQIEGSDKIYSESEFKKLLSEGYLDKVMMDKGIKIKGIKADEALASSFQLPSAIKPQVQTTAEVTETVTPTAEVSETVTTAPEVKEEVSTSKKIEELLPKPEKPIDQTKKGVFGKKDRAYKKRLSQYEDDLDNWNKSIKFFNNNPDAVEFYENANEEQKKYILRYSIWKSDSKDLDLNELSEYRFIQDDGTFLISSKGFTMKINDFENAPTLKDGGLDFDKVKYDVVNPKGEVVYSTSNYDDAKSLLYKENSKYQLQKLKATTPEAKTEEVVTPTETVTEEKSFDDRVAEEYAKLTKQVSYKENPKKETEYAKNEIKNSYRYKNGEISAKEYLESKGNSDNTIIGNKRFSELSDDEIKYKADTGIEFFDKLINGARQKVQDETVTKTEEVVTEPTTEVKEQEVVVDGNDLILKHGTPHDFDKFQLEKIGTGEGAQAFGYGLYFTDGSKIAEGYAKKLSEDKTGLVYEVRIKNGATKNWSEWRDTLDQDVEDKLYNSLTKSEKAEYQKHLDKAFYPDSPNYDMNYEKDYTGSFDELKRDKYGLETYEKPSAVGNIYSDLKDAFGQEKATEIFKRAGIDGIKYRSRRGFGDNYNYVVFDPNSIEIIKKEAPSATETKEQKQKINVNPLQGYSFTYESEQDIPNELKGVSPIVRSESTVGRGKKAKTNIRLTFSGQQLIDAGLGQQEGQTTTETKQPTKEAQVAKGLADTLRKAKFNLPKGTAMASFAPGFDKVWDATIETVAKAIEVGGVTAGNFRQSIEAGMKAFKKTDTYKAITDPKERAKISAQYKKALVDLVPQHYNFSTDDLRNAEFETFNQKLEESKGKKLSAKEFNAIKSEAKKFVNDNLPSDKYRKSEVQSYVRNNFDKAKTVEDIQKNLDKVNNIIIAKEEKIQKETDKKAAKDRKELIKDIQSKIKPSSKSVVGADKKGKISLDSQRALNSYVDDLKRRGVYNSLDTLTDAELSDMNEDLDTIINTGKSERKALKSIEDRKKKESQALILQALAKGNPIILNGKEGIMDKLEKTSGVVIIDNQAMNLKDFKDYSTLNPDAELRDIPFYRKETTERIKEKTKPGIFKSLKTKYTLFGLADVETGLIKLGTGSSKLKTWLENEIWAPIRAAERKKIINEAQLVSEYKDKANEVFGTIEIPVPFKEKGIMVKSMLYSALAKPSGIKRIDPSQVTGETDELTAGKVVHLYGILNNPDISKEEKQADIDRLRRYNNVDAKDIIKFMEDPKNKEYLDYYNVIKDFYNGKLGDEFKPSIEDLYNIALQDKYYYPRPAAGTVVEGENLITPESGVGALSAIAPNMRPREEKTPTTAFAEVDAHEMMMNYIDSMTRAKEYIPIAKAANVLLSDINRPYVISKFNDLNAYNTFIKDLNLSILGTTPTQDFPQLHKLNNLTNLGLLWFRVKSVPTQAIAFVNYYSAGIKDGITPMHILAASAPVNKAELEFWDKFYTDNPYLLYRLSGGNITPETQAIQREIESAAKKYSKGLMSLATFVGLLEIKGGDLLSIASPLGGASFAAAEFRKNYNQSKDFDDAREKAMQRWYEETERTQQLSASKEIVSNASYSLGYKFMFPFSSAQAGYMKKAYKGYLNLKDWDSLNNKEKIQSFSDMIYYPLFANLSFLLMSGGALAYWQLSDDKEDDEKKKSLKEKQKQRIRYDLLMDDLQSSIQMMGFPGKILNGFLNSQRGRALFNEVPLFQMFSKVYDAFTPLMKIDPNLKFSEMTKEQQEKIKERYPSSIFSNPIRNQSEKEAVDKAFQELSAFEKISEKEKEKMFKAFMLTNPINFANSFAEYAKGEISTSEFFQGKKRDPKKAEGSLLIDYFDDKPSEETFYRHYDELTNKILKRDAEAESYFTEEMRPKKEKVKGKREGGRSKRRGRRGR